ncbi:MAG: hypothetical protein KF729_22295 [Sandaracinaceae bacterium]|nr:hypothetical protein [Sandaracinaceae bacterium]
MLRWVFAIVLGAWGAAPAAASTGADPAAAAEALAGAREALAEGAPGRAFELARLARAFDPRRSVEAWELMGRASSARGEQAAAHRFFRRALGVASRAERARLLARMQLARDELGLVRLDVQPGGARVLVDGEPAEVEPGGRVLLLRPGVHRIEARLEGYTPRVGSVVVTAGGEHTARFALSPGAEGDEPRWVAPPSSPRLARRWLTGNALLVGVGALGFGVTASLDRPRVEAEVALSSGASLGLALGAGLHLALQAALDPEGGGRLTIPRILLTPLLAGVAIAVGMTTPSATGAQDAVLDPGRSGVAGALLGLGIATFANTALGERDVPIGIGAGLALAALAGFEATMGLVSVEAADAIDREGGDADAAAGHRALAETSLGLAAGLGALAIGSLALGIAGDADALDLAVGPGSLTVSGSF